MPLGTLDRRVPSLFRQGPSALSQLAFYSALALFLMVADARFKLTEPVRQAVATVLYPVQWLMVQPVALVNEGMGYLQSMEQAQAQVRAADQRLAQVAQSAHLAEQLQDENLHLRALLALREHLPSPGQAAEVIHDTPDPYTRRVVIDRGETSKIALGSPVLDANGVLGQVTRVYPLRSEVTLLIDRDQAIPVFNPRTGARSVAYGDPAPGGGGSIELRFVPSNADVVEGDLLTTSGVDGVYPAGIPVARVLRVEHRADSAFSRIHCEPMARVQQARHVLVLAPQALASADDAPAAQAPAAKPAATPAARPAAAPAAPAAPAARAPQENQR
ncbi:rod shape-determining protein MreC [Comamonas endophytica]|uniref:Cell shape-determining protein MreC n=1 Tax=Comamonas endophytica TaxID=2949090 RepID=A0ABY6GDB2_9BURK|nr:MULTISPECIES: rod shape-determining protein MreC [unclassified Acidovorax]MCD2512595.1 rod shape-determining protein MreC [Acidovorax sp. D4N7]UYG53045.1 rod shape-determining protein MreC [Acidovorax sp. 5MLIR]